MGDRHAPKPKQSYTAGKWQSEAGNSYSYLCICQIAALLSYRAFLLMAQAFIDFYSTFCLIMQVAKNIFTTPHPSGRVSGSDCGGSS